MTIKINVNNDCLKCPCCDKITYSNGNSGYLCKAFKVILIMNTDYSGNIISLERCKQCIENAIEDEA